MSMTAKLENNYFSDPLKWTVVIGSLLSAGYLFYAEHHQWVVLLLFLISIILFSTRYVLLVDTDRKIIHDSFYFIWIKVKFEEFKFDDLHGVRMDKQRHIYNATTRSRVRQADFNEYIATLEFDDGKSVELERAMEYESFAERMKQFATELKIPINRTY